MSGHENLPPNVVVRGIHSVVLSVLSVHSLHEEGSWFAMVVPDEDCCHQDQQKHHASLGHQGKKDLNCLGLKAKKNRIFSSNKVFLQLIS